MKHLIVVVKFTALSDKGNLGEKVHGKHCVNPWNLSIVYVSVNLVIIGSDNGLLPVWHQAIICTNAGLLSI